MDSHARQTATRSPDARPADDSTLAIILLCLAAGYADAIGYLHHQVFAANMTGNTVLASMSLAQQQWDIAWERVAPLLAFFGGAALSSLCDRLDGKLAHLPLLAEALLLAVASTLDPDRIVWLWLTAVAMGMQGTMMVRYRHATLSTVVITSTIARLGQSVVGLTVPSSAAKPAEARPAPGMLALTWLLYCIGAVVATLLSPRMPYALSLSAILIFVAALVQRRRSGMA